MPLATLPAGGEKVAVPVTEVFEETILTASSLMDNEPLVPLTDPHGRHPEKQTTQQKSNNNLLMLTLL